MQRARLTADQVAQLIRASVGQKQRRHPDGNNLYLVTRNGRGFWVYQYWQTGIVRSKGLGPCPPTTPAQARKAREAFVVALRSGTAPAPRQAAPAGPVSGKSFADIVGEYINAKGSQWRGGADGHEGRLYKSLVNTSLALIPINTIATADILAALEPWAGKASAKRIRGRIERVIDFATALGYRSGENPARYKGHLAHILPTDNGAEKHHAALPYKQVPKLMKQLGNDSADRALGFTILTAARRGETLGATWSEIIGDEWVIPSNRMKAGREHRVPLTKAALALLGKRGADDAYVFPGKRTTLIEKRRALMAAWAKYAC
jgi:integrase